MIAQRAEGTTCRAAPGRAYAKVYGEDYDVFAPMPVEIASDWEAA